MPFPARVITTREDIGEVIVNNNADILSKTNVSNLIGLLNQFNKISLYAHEIFSDVLSTTNSTHQRIESVKKRIHTLHSDLPKVENMLISSAPNFFYDNPYPGKEYLRNDAMNGLLFSREDASSTLNRRRSDAMPPTELSAMDRVSKTGPCIKQFSDADFFINEWLANEKRKREEERERRRQMKANRKKGKVKRKNPKTIKAIKRKRYDAHGNEIMDKGPTEIAVTQYRLSGDTNRDFDALLKSNKKSKHKTSAKQDTSPQNISSESKHEHMVSYTIPNDAKQKAHVSVLSEATNPPPFEPSQATSNQAIVPPPNPEQQKMVPPPNPLQMSPSQRSKQKIMSLSAEIPMNDISYDIPENARSPKHIYAEHYQKRDLENEQLSLSAASNIITTSPKDENNNLFTVAPKLGFLSDITAFKKNGLRHTQTNVNRHKPKDKRSNLLDALRGDQARQGLSSVNLRNVPKREEKKNLIFRAMADRRRHLEGSSDEEEDSDWGSDSE